MTLHLYTDLAEWWPLFSPPEEYGEEAAHLLTLLRPPAGTRRASLLELGSGGGSLAMLAQSRRVNQRVEHIQGDMRTLDLDRRFDRVLVHDAIMYATTAPDVLATLMTARRHCRLEGHVVVVPDWVNPGDTQAETAWTFILRDASGRVTFDGETDPWQRDVFVGHPIT